MAKQTTPIRYDMKPNEVNSFSFDYMQEKGYKVTDKDLSALGIGMDTAVFQDVKNIFNASVGLDESIPLQTIPTISNPVQFFQYLVPKAVEFVTQARTLDKIFGRTVAGSFEDEQIVTSTIELTGQAQPYTDTANIPLASWNNSYVTRDIVRFELGLEVGYLEAMRAARMRIDDNAQKKNAVANALAIELNNVGFFGYSNGSNNTYGLLNEQGLAPYRTVAEGVSNSTLWKDKTFAEITADIATAVRQLRLQLAGWLNTGLGDSDGDRTPITLVVSLGAVDWLASKFNELGSMSVIQWLKATYPNMRIISSPEMENANGGSNVFYLIADTVLDTDTGKQYVQDTLRLVGIEKKAKVVIEDYAAATAGVVIQQPLGIVRYSGI